MPGGRPSDYREEYAAQAFKLALLGMTDAEMAAFFEVAESTLHLWKNVHAEFSEAISAGKENADGNVAEKLYRRAMGYSHEAVKIFQYEGQPVVVPYTEHYPPDTQAASLWLRNRQPAKWRDKQEHEHTGKDGKDLIPPETDPRRLALALHAIVAGAAKGEEPKE